jgi:hypothetical protein
MRQDTHTSPGPLQSLIGRTPIKRGQRYQFPGYGDAGFIVSHVELPGHPEYDGGWPGVGIQWVGHNFHRRMRNAFYTFRSEADFWACHLFKCAVDYVAPNPEPSRSEADGSGALLGDNPNEDQS